jgi:hypothetical protein
MPEKGSETVQYAVKKGVIRLLACPKCKTGKNIKKGVDKWGSGC